MGNDSTRKPSKENISPFLSTRSTVTSPIVIEPDDIDLRLTTDLSYCDQSIKKVSPLKPSQDTFHSHKVKTLSLPPPSDNEPIVINMESDSEERAQNVYDKLKEYRKAMLKSNLQRLQFVEFQKSSERVNLSVEKVDSVSYESHSDMFCDVDNAVPSTSYAHVNSSRQTSSTVRFHDIPPSAANNEESHTDVHELNAGHKESSWRLSDAPIDTNINNDVRTRNF